MHDIGPPLADNVLEAHEEEGQGSEEEEVGLFLPPHADAAGVPAEVGGLDQGAEGEVTIAEFGTVIEIVEQQAEAEGLAVEQDNGQDDQ
ncbi:MAG: hypothetical protein JSV03_02595 [Planctomycetota bacterium]|nr:MAG: hypothetical protein JSV03_02595 [Planctomycetota bacterium]